MSYENSWRESLNVHDTSVRKVSEYKLAGIAAEIALEAQSLELLRALTKTLE